MSRKTFLVAIISTARLALRWFTASELRGEDAEAAKSAAAGFEVALAGLLIARLFVLEVRGGLLQAFAAILGVQGQGVDESVGSVADLAQSDGRIFPP